MRLVVALQHWFAVLAEREEVLPQDWAASKGFRLIDVHLKRRNGAAVETQEFVAAQPEDRLSDKIVSWFRDHFYHCAYICSNEYASAFVDFKQIYLFIVSFCEEVNPLVCEFEVIKYASDIEFEVGLIDDIERLVERYHHAMLRIVPTPHQQSIALCLNTNYHLG